MHGYFLRPGDARKPITFGVQRLRDGRSFSARRVHAYQDGEPILSMIASSQEPVLGLEHQSSMPEGMPEGGPGGGMPGGSNVLVERFTAVEAWADLVTEAEADLVEELYDSGYAEQVLDRWTTVLTEQAGDLVDADTVQQEADAIRETITG